MQRRWANISLGILLLLLVVALAFRHSGWAPYLLGMALAGLAGGIADWYAVTALFRHPLGLKWLPHTSIISANRERIINAIATLVETELLSLEYVTRQLDKLPWDRWITEGLTSDWPRPVAAWIGRHGRDWLADVAPAEWGSLVKNWTERQAASLSLSDGLVTLIRWLVASGHDRDLFQFLAQHVRVTLDSVEFTDEMESRLKLVLEQYTKTTTQKFFLGLLESLGTVDYRDLSLSLKHGLLEWLESDKALDQFELLLVRMMMALRDNPTVRERVEAFKMGALGQIPWEEVVVWLRAQVTASVEPEKAAETLEKVRHAVTDWLRNHPEALHQVSDALTAGAARLVRQYHPVLGRLVRDNLNQMNEREWIDKLEWYVGRDLQWIRINGAIVGGLVGLLITVVTRLLRL